MKLHQFINEQLEAILAEWVAFARLIEPEGGNMSLLALRDHAKAILQEIAHDMETRQNSRQQLQKSRGLAPEDDAAQSAASIHGALRHADDFTLLELSAEFRALRATVLRLWLPRLPSMDEDTIVEMVRFNEAIDQALAESIVTYSARDNATREMFLAILGHDLRAPLSTVAMTADLLKRQDVEPGAALVEQGNRLMRAARLMQNMVADLLGYASTQLGGRMPMHVRQGDLKPICAGSIEDASAMYPRTRFELQTHGNLDCEFDAVRMHQLLTNLLVNAAQYGGADRPVQVAASGDHELVSLHVTNFGAVIPPEALDSIFKPLVQLPTDLSEADARPRTSLGLGLHIARQIAHAHGGELTVRSDAKDGTTFTARIRRAGPTPRVGAPAPETN